MKINVQKWGNSLALRIPKSFALETHIKQGASVDISLEKGKLVIKPIPEKKYTLDDLLSRITKQNIHKEVDTGQIVGREVW